VVARYAKFPAVLKAKDDDDAHLQSAKKEKGMNHSGKVFFAFTLSPPILEKKIFEKKDGFVCAMCMGWMDGDVFFRRLCKCM
jgi:hypothetical protein